MQTALLFGQWLKQRRQELDLTQEGLAEAAGCSVDMVRKIESGRRRPSRQIADLLASSLNIPPEQQPSFVQWARGVSDEGFEGGKPKADPRSPISAIQPRATTYLPAPPTALVGRTYEVAQARNMLWRAATRLVTLTGPPGIGKTRLAIAVAASLQGDFQDGLLFVPLASIPDPELVASTLAHALGVAETPQHSHLVGLQEHLRDRQMLLILDNFEQVVEAAPVVSELLSASLGLKIIVTSRIPLHLRGEKVLSLPPLAIPDSQRQVPLDELARLDGVMLFVERAQDVSADFDLDAANGHDVAAICARLDGLPLAIELAAAKLRLLTPGELLAHLDKRLPFLTDGPRDAPLQQQTLRRAIESSYDLLSPHEQEVFRRLGVFAGSFTLDEAGAVTGANLNMLTALVDQSLLRPRQTEIGQVGARKADSASQSGFTMLETIREYALERLEGITEAETIRRSHAEYYLALAEAARLNWTGPHRKEWLERLEWSRHDLRSALHWMRNSGDVEMTLRMAAAIWNFWYAGGYISEGLDELMKVLSLSKCVNNADRATVLYAAGQFAMMRDDRAAERSYYEESLAAARKLQGSAEDKKALSMALRGMAHLAANEGDHVLSRQYAEERLAIHKELGDEQGVAASLYHLGTVAFYEERYELARNLLEESLGISRRIDARSPMGATYVNLGEVARAQGDYAASRSYFEDALAVWREIGGKRGVSVTLRSLGYLTIEEGNPAEALKYFAESLAFHYELGERGSIAKCLAGIVVIWGAQGCFQAAAKLLGATEVLIAATHPTFEQIDQVHHARSLGEIRTALGEEAFTAARDEGAAMSLDDTVAFALDSVHAYRS